ncbi:COG3014 family protein [Candidatus Venteria ishoeyi]|nr:hypothetical protein [Candidatus Venteria ishoeyi]
MIKLSFLIILGLLSTGCASSLWSPYPQQIQPQLQQLDQGQTPQLLYTQSSAGNADLLLNLLEKARFAQIRGETALSMLTFERALAEFDDNDIGAIFRLSDIGSQGVALVTNDNVMPYRGAIFERVFAHHFQALNYLFWKDLEGAGVEVRRGNLAQQQANTRYAKELEKLEAKRQQVPVDFERANHYFKAMDREAAQVRTSFQNAYSYYVSALIYELRDELDDAYIDYRNALKLAPDNSVIQADVLRLAKQLGDQETAKTLQQDASLSDNVSDAGGSELIIFYENGFAPPKQEVSFPIPYRYGLVAISFPIYQGYSIPGSLIVSRDQHRLGRTQMLTKVASMVAKALQEQRVGLIIRQLGRAVAKAELQRFSYDQGGNAVGLLVNLYNLFSEHADLRSWLSLPNNVQLLRIHVPAGIHQLQFQDSASGLRQNLSIDAPARSRNILRVINTGSRFYLQMAQFY